MPSSLTWIDQDADARERSLRILALFQEKESRDELGLGGIRDSFSEDTGVWPSQPRASFWS